eukprot:TRINITY_DN2540_c0_g1_i1.p1 TRINITY_DN2540_c0_g1~~TRINITY_DN2540_c0_g1_i1.p1  ORF type:complete len:149 (+),score=14.15 TRINITY_DN2540_c0_g1_i1:83-529(+)
MYAYFPALIPRFVFPITPVGPLQCALGVFQGHPQMGSFMCIELYRKTRKSPKDMPANEIPPNTRFTGPTYLPDPHGEDPHFIRVLVDKRAVPIAACGGKVYCPLESFLELLRPHLVLPSEYEVECTLPAALPPTTTPTPDDSVPSSQV